MSCLVKWNALNVYFVGDIMLMPGINEISKEDLGAIKSHPICRHEIEAGKIELLNDDTDEDAAGNLASLKPAEAAKIIGECVVLELLTKWKSEEKRAPVVKAIEAQILKLGTIIKPAEAEAAEGEHFA